MGATLWQSGDHCDYTPTAATPAGTVVNLGPVTGGMVGVAANDIDADRLGSLTVAGVHFFENSGVAFGIGDPVAYQIATDDVAATGDFVLGTAYYAAAATAGDRVYVLLNGRSI